MEKVIKIGKKEVTLSNNVAWTMEYRDQFGKDIVPTIMPMLMSVIESIASVVSDTGRAEVNVKDLADAVSGRSMELLLPLYQLEFVDLVNITWAMAKAANDDIEPPNQWVRQFEDFPLDVVVPAVYDMVLKGFVSSKNLKRLKTAGKSLKNLQPSLSTISSSQDLSED